MDDRIRWKNGARCAVTLTFDLDGESLWIARDPALAERPLHMGMGAYGPRTGAPRILGVLDRYGLKAGWFIPGFIIERYPDLCREIVRRGHEVGYHGYLHEKPAALPGPEEEEAILVRTLGIFDSVLGVRPRGARVPSCDPSRHTMEILRKHGFLYHSNLMDADLPYTHKTSYGELVELPTAWVNDDWVYFAFSGSPPVGHGIRSQEDVFEIWREEFEGAYAEGGFFNLMGHPQVIGRASRMRMVERLLQHMLARPGVWIARPHEVAEQYLSQR
ncbi:MAG TPA: polysaccharide deacetylase [Methylomirabilota bacterium]|nr:polysaccharide deacetylase [Methylomirabilota bacterium]